MRRFFVLIGVCVGALAGVPGAQAAIITNSSSPVSLSVFVPCANVGAGELIDVSGPLHTVISMTVNGNHFSAKDHFQPQGISGTGETTGAKYQATGVTQDQSSGSFVNGQFQANVHQPFRHDRPGTGQQLQRSRNRPPDV